MSLFFLILSVITYLASHYSAKRTRPQDNFSKAQASIYSGDLKSFDQQLKKWVSRCSRLIILESRPGYYLISEEPGVLSYGSFHHITATQEKEEIRVSVLTQAKLISSPLEKSPFNQELGQELGLQNVS